MKKILTALALILFIQAPSYSEMRGITVNGTVANSTSSIIVEVEGIAYLGENDTPNQARRNALLQAKRNAAEFALTKIKSSTTVEDFVLTKDIIEAQSDAYITILEQKNLPTVGNEYKVWIKADVKANEIKQKEQTQVNVDSEAPLKVFAWTQKTEYKKGEKLNFSVQLNKDGYVIADYVMADGSKIQIFPNKFWTDNFVKGGEQIDIPSQKMNFDFTVTPPFGVEKLVIHASNTKITPSTTKKGLVISQKDDFAEYSEAFLEIRTKK